MDMRLKWFKGKKLGFFSHFLVFPTIHTSGVDCSAAEWNETVESFDVALLAEQLHACHADYYCITIGQNSGHYCSPNTTYDRLTGISPSKCSKRDLIVDLANALERYNIDLLVYLPSGAPAADPEAQRKLKWEWGYKGKWPENHSGERTGNRLVDFQHMWESVISEWSQRWGTKVKGWWIDGCYFAEDMYDFPDEPNFQSFTEAIRAGNPHAVIALNTGTKKPFDILCRQVDYTAGEVSFSLPLAVDHDGRMIGMQEKLSGKKLHILSYLAEKWGQGDPRFPDALVAGYTKYINDHDGLMTWDIPLCANGSIPDKFLEQLKAITQNPCQGGQGSRTVTIGKGFDK